MLTVTLPAFALLAVWEILFAWRRDWSPDIPDLLRGTAVWLLGKIAGVGAVIVVFALLPWSDSWGRTDLIALEVAAGLVVADYAFYWLHRLSHHPTIWPWHAWHHQPEKLNSWVTDVGHPLFLFATVVARLLPCVLLGLSAEAITLVGVIQIIVSRWGHANIAGRYRWLSWLVVTPEIHQWHHAPGARVNYGLVFPWWDWLHGTFRLPQSRIKRVGAIGHYPGEYDLAGQLLLEKQV